MLDLMRARTFTHGKKGCSFVFRRAQLWVTESTSF
uniref:Uncharacterized protein n=1 Tax=Rhizophora mucronata TaxID=61149 RepID=A0A2P2QUI6_RHIMU